MIVKTLFDFGLLCLGLWGICNEDKFIAFEERVAERMRERRETRWTAQDRN